MRSATGASGSRITAAGGLIILIAAIVAPLALLAPRTPTAIMAMGAVLGTVLLARRGMWPAHPPRTLLWLMAGTAGWAAVSAWWALDPAEAIRGAVKLAGNLGGGLLLIGVARRAAAGAGRWLDRALAVGVGAAVTFLGIEAAFGAPISWWLWRPFEGIGDYAWQVGNYGAFWLDPGTAVAALLVWPLILGWRRVPAWAGGAILAAIAVIAMRLSFEAGVLAVAAGGTAAIAVGALGERAGRVLAALAFVAILAAPLAPRSVLDPDALSAREDTVPLEILPRFHIWAFAAERIAEKPVLGWGMNAARSIPGGKQPIHDSVRDKQMGEVMPLHPHNGALQVWMELGLPGAILLAGIAAWVLWRASCLGDGSGGREAAAATGLLVTAAVLLSLSFGIWQSWWLASIFIASALLRAVAENRRAATAGAPPSLP